jgi:sensor c-di-GMP phosphodiesterase-like protein
MSPKQRSLVQSVCIVLALCLLTAGLALLIARFFILTTATARLKTYASEILQQDEKLAANINATLASANASTFPECSAQDLVVLRNLLFRSPFLKDVGREHDGQFFCSAIVGVLPKPIHIGKPDIKTYNGRMIYFNVLLSAAEGAHGEIVEFDRANVVLSPDVFAEFDRPPLYFSGGVVNFQQHTFLRTYSNAPRPATLDLILAKEEMIRDNILYFGACSTIRPDCVLTSIALADIWAPNRPFFLIAASIGALIGVLFGGTILFMRTRDHSLPNRLRRAVRQKRLTVVYQPIVEVMTGAIVAAEALVRWNDDDGNPVRPDTFIAVAEEHDFVGEITTLVLDRVTDDLGDILRSGPPFRVSVNMSAQDLTDQTFIPRLQKLLQTKEVPAAGIGLELTERSTAERDVVIESIRQLRANGHVVYIDDFGTGYSSLAYLSELDVDVLKVDRAFTQTIGTSSVTANIVPQILAMGKALRLKIVVEGIELQEQATYLADIDAIIQGQGWLFGKPVSAQQIRERLMQDAALPGSA